MTETEFDPAAWRQVTVTSADWRSAERVGVALLGPLLSAAEDAGRISLWWFVRKAETWRVRLLPADSRTTTVVRDLARALQGTATVAAGFYEAETYRLGGNDAADAAHRLFHADSRHILQHLAHSGDDHRRELGLRLATRMMAAAGQDWYEQGDVWNRVAAHRGNPEAPKTALAAVQLLVTAAEDAPDSPLVMSPSWPAAYEQAGSALAEMARRGDLTRGLRAVLADHLMFAFNRLGISVEDQGLLAAAASDVVFRQHPADLVNPDHGSAPTTTLSTVTTDITDQMTTDPQRLRDALVARIAGLGTFRTPQVERAFRTVPRENFLPGVDLETAYGRKAVVTKRAADGTAVSSASAPNIVATMLEQLDAAPGHRVLEIGAATGINAALLAELVTPAGAVVTIEFDEDLTDGARRNLAEAGYGWVKVICGDGALGDPAEAPYDRIEVTAGAWDISAAWWDQLAIGGRIVVPLRLHGSGLTRSLAFDRTTPDQMVSTNSAVCGFVPMRGAAEMGEQHVRLADDVILKVDTADRPDETGLSLALHHPAHQQWTGIEVRHDEPAAHLDLWLATHGDLGFGRLSIGPAAHALSLADPAIRWAGAALYDGGTIAYITSRDTDDDTIELGITAQGQHAEKTAGKARDLLEQWSATRPAQPIITAYPANTPDDQLGDGVRVTRPDTRLTIAW